MKKGIFSVIILFCCCLMFAGCIKNTPYVTTIEPSMTASMGTYHFVASSVVPSSLDTQLHDSTTTLIITGNTSDQTYPQDKIIISITKYRGLTGVFSIVQGQANGVIYHASNPPDVALGGIVAITQITSNTITGYFNFNTASGVVLTNGLFSVGKP